ncbi:MAG: hypothetical protein V9E89_03700 [Ilumatobacteraceae bacterium]
MTSRPQHSAATLRRRRMLSLTWAGLAIGWSLVRAIIAWAVLGDYGLNPWVYLAIDVASATVDAITTPRMVISFVDRQYKRALLWALCSLVAFIIPDLYLFLGTGHLPKKIIVVMAIIITATFTVAVISVLHKVRKARAERLAALVESRLQTDVNHPAGR